MVTVTVRDRSKRKGGKSGKKRNAHFMDVAIEAYVRHLALTKLREVEDLRETLGLSLAGALAEANTFVDRAPYHNLWHEAWEAMLSEQANPSEGSIFTAIEEACGRAIMAEQEARKQAGEPAVDDTAHYADFIGSAMGRLLEEASGEVEEF